MNPFFIVQGDQSLEELGLNFTSNSLDYFHLSDEQEKSALSINTISALSQFITTPPLEEKNKTVIIESFKGLSPIFQNKVLKLLEEPPEYVKIYLFNRSIEEPLLKTLLSRGRVISSLNGLKTEEDQEFVQVIEHFERREISLLEFTQSIRTSKQKMRTLIKHCIKKEKKQEDYENKEKLLEIIAQISQNHYDWKIVAPAICYLAQNYLHEGPSDRTRNTEQN